MKTLNEVVASKGFFKATKGLFVVFGLILAIVFWNFFLPFFNEENIHEVKQNLPAILFFGFCILLAGFWVYSLGAAIKTKEDINQKK